MDVTQKKQDRQAFRTFLRKHRYMPQGRLSRVGMLEEKDLDAMLRGKVVPVWRWIWQNIKNEEDMKLIGRNVTLAQHNLASCKAEREDAKQTRITLENKRNYLRESLQKAKQRERELLRQLRAVEHEEQRMVGATADTKQREVLKRAFGMKNEEVIAKMSDQMQKIRMKVTANKSAASLATGHSAAQTNALQGKRNPIQVLLDEYLRMLKASNNNDSVDFGDSDIAHLREFGSSTLMRWLAEDVDITDRNNVQDKEEAAYATHVEVHVGSSRDALTQVQELLACNQKEHIARFLETQNVYVKAKRLKAMIDERTAELASSGSTEGEIWSSGGDRHSSQDGKNADIIAETVDLEIEKAIQLESLRVASEMYAKMSQQVQESKQRRLDLDHKLDLMQSFDQRQQQIVAQIDAMYQQNQSLLEALPQKQQKNHQFVLEELAAKYHHKSEELVRKWQKLVMQELRLFSSIRLDRVETAVRSVQLPMNEFNIESDSSTRRINTQVSFPDFYINQIQQTEEDSGENGFQRIFKALRVPEYGNWELLLDKLDLSDHQQETLASMNQELSQLEKELKYDHGRSQPHDSGSVEELLLDLANVRKVLEAEAFPQLEEIMAVNKDMYTQILPRLRRNLENWYEQQGWDVSITAPTKAAAKTIE